jgi:hypothetical protein
MKRIIVVCEGPTEKVFCERILYPYFISKGYYIQAPVIKHSKGGIVKWEILKKQIETHLISEPGAFVTTFIDYYGLYQKYSFPNWENAERTRDKSERMRILEAGMSNDIGDNLRNRFIPYLQLHEFEGLLFNDINIFYEQIPAADLVNLNELQSVFQQYDNPEMINNNVETSPSHRLMRIISGYNKIVYGDILAEAIGLKRMMQKSPRFNEWILNLSKL